MQCTCGGELEQGFVPDFGPHAVWATVWLPGPPDAEKPFWESLGTGAGVRIAQREPRVVDAWRCVACGRLELYATRPPPKGATPAG